MSSNNNNILSMVEAKLPPGFRFHPRDDELICDYLMKKVVGGGGGCDEDQVQRYPGVRMVEVDLNKSEPWEIPESACVGGKEWYFYSQRDRKYSSGLRTNRATATGYWKATGKDRAVFRKAKLVGMRKTLVFYQGRAPKGRKTDWVMHEFRLQGSSLSSSSSSSIHRIIKEEDWVLCRVFFKNREILPKQQLVNGAVVHGGDHHDIFCSSLPPLMDPYINFTQTHNNNNNETNEQVPCFSIFTPADQISISSSSSSSCQPFSYLMASNTSTYDPNLISNIMVPNFGGNLPEEFGGNKTVVVRAVLNELTKMEQNNNNLNNPLITAVKSSPSFGEAAASSDSYLSEAALSTMWNQY